MLRKAHKRFLSTVGLLLLFALVIAAITQAAVIERNLLYNDANCQAAFDSDLRAGLVGQDLCINGVRAPEPFSVLVFGAVLAGAGFAVRRQFTRAD